MVIIYDITMMLLMESAQHSLGLAVWAMETVSWIYSIAMPHVLEYLVRIYYNYFIFVCLFKQ